MLTTTTHPQCGKTVKWEGSQWVHVQNVDILLCPDPASIMAIPPPASAVPAISSPGGRT